MSSLLTGVVQYLQFRYQQGVLYRLKALGERHNMDITIEGFHSWMWRGLSFLLPFLYVGYIYQLYNAYTLYTLIFHPEATWQVSVHVCVFDFSYLSTLCLVEKYERYTRVVHLDNDLKNPQVQ